MVMLGLLLASCNRDITEPVLSSNPTKSTLSNMSFNGQFNVSNADSLMSFSWSAVDFGFPASITYAVQLSPVSDFSKNVANLITTQSLNGTAKVSDVNKLILAWNYSIGTEVNVYYRVAASINPNVDTVYSAVKTISLTPYDAVINYPMVYVPGSYQGWSPGADTGRLYSYGFNSTYGGIIRLKNGTDATVQFKVTVNPNWNGPNYGGTLTQSGTDYSGVLDPNGGNFEVLPACYSFSVDVDAKTITLTKTDDWGIIGDATANGWNASSPMFYNGQRKMWEITANFTVGSFKFRANDAWDLNYGSNANDGTLQAGGSNIPITTAGNYTIRFDPVNLTYTVIKN